MNWATIIESTTMQTTLAVLYEIIEFSRWSKQLACRLFKGQRGIPKMSVNGLTSAAIAILLLVSTHSVAGLLHDIHEVLDLSNLDLANFQFFKNLPSQNPRTAARSNHFIEHFQKKKAFLDYFEHLFFGNSPFTQHSEIPFDPHFGRAWRPYYERKYGRRGERLIAALGQGYKLGHHRSSGVIITQRLGRIYYPS